MDKTFSDLMDIVNRSKRYDTDTPKPRAKKPAPDLVIYAMKECGCERAIFVGDSDTDVMTANNAGIPVISVTWGFRDRDFLAANGATLFADSAEELSDKIFELLGNN